MPDKYSEEDYQHFKNNVQRSGECLLWMKGPRTQYPHFRTKVVGGKKVYIRAHIASYEMHVGPIPDGLFVCHHCDTPRCVEPKHLFVGTNADNLADMRRKGRHAHGDRTGSHLHPESRARGERHGSRTHPESVKRGTQKKTSRLDEDAVRTIRELYAQHITQRQLAGLYGVSRSAIEQVVCRRSWAWVGDTPS